MWNGTASKNSRNGAVLIYVAVAIIAFIAMTSLVVDIAHLRVVKTQLQFAADSAARNAAAGLSSRSARGSAKSNAIAAAALVNVDGTPVVVQPSDVVIGTWAGSTFTPGGASPNAVKVTVTRSAARGNAVPIWWGAIIGKTSADVTATSIASGKATQMAGFMGYAGVYMKTSAFFGSYDSRNQKTPNASTAGRKARVGSNTLISGWNNDTIQGDEVLGPNATADPGIVLTGSALVQPTDLPTPTMPTWAPPGGTALPLVVASNTVMPGGSYWYSSMTVTATLTFSGVTTIYVNGDIYVDGTLTPASGKPGDLTIYQIGAHNFGDLGINGLNLTAGVYAPNSDFLSKNSLSYYGGGIFNTITTKNNAEFYYDIMLGPADGSPVVTTVK
jgi:Flp pilus assembly protein TadG